MGGWWIQGRVVGGVGVVLGYSVGVWGRWGQGCMAGVGGRGEVELRGDVEGHRHGRMGRGVGGV